MRGEVKFFVVLNNVVLSNEKHSSSQSSNIQSPLIKYTWITNNNYKKRIWT